MDVLPKCDILEHNSIAVEAIRKQFDLDRAGTMDHAIDLLDEWIRKQPHFVEKNFPREYLERTIISCKGSVERAKTRIDKICTLRTRLPHFYVDLDTREDVQRLLSNMTFAPLPRLTEDYYRICMTKLCSETSQEKLLDYYRYNIVALEYLKAHDYMNGIIIVSDMRYLNVVEMVKNVNFADMHQASSLIIEGIGLRVKEIHLLLSSSTVNTIVAILKQILPTKIGDRINTHKTLDSLQQHIPEELLPADYGGKVKPLNDLNEEWISVFGSEDHIKYMKQVKNVKTDERYRQQDVYCNQYLDVPGTFRALKVD